MPTDTQKIIETSKETRLTPLYRVLLFNDDWNTTVHVTLSLIEIFHYEVQAAEQIMWEAHTNGVAIASRREPLEQAEFHRDQLKAKFLTASIEPAD